MSLERDPRAPEQTQVRQGQPWSSAGHTDPPCPAASLGLCSSTAPMLGVSAPSWCPARAGVTQCMPVLPAQCASPMHSPRTAFFCTKKSKEFWAPWPELSSFTQSNDREPGLQPVATVLLAQFAQFAITGAGQLLPFGSHKHQAMSCPNALAGCAASLGASVPPLTQMHITHGTSYGSKRSSNVMFEDTKMCSACWKLGDW